MTLDIYIDDFVKRRNAHVRNVSSEFGSNRVLSFRYLGYQIDQGTEERLLQIQIELPDDQAYSSGEASFENYYTGITVSVIIIEIMEEVRHTCKYCFSACVASDTRTPSSASIYGRRRNS